MSLIDLFHLFFVISYWQFLILILMGYIIIYLYTSNNTRFLSAFFYNILVTQLYPAFIIRRGRRQDIMLRISSCHCLCIMMIMERF